MCEGKMCIYLSTIRDESEANKKKQKQQQRHIFITLHIYDSGNLSLLAMLNNNSTIVFFGFSCPESWSQWCICQQMAQ